MNDDRYQSEIHHKRNGLLLNNIFYACETTNGPIDGRQFSGNKKIISLAFIRDNSLRLIPANKFVSMTHSSSKRIAFYEIRFATRGPIGMRANDVVGWR